MPTRDRIDGTGALALVAFSALLAFNQVVIAVVNEGLQPVFFAGLRSLGSLVCLVLWFRFRRRPLGLSLADWRAGLLIGLAFAVEFICLFVALDLTTLTRVSVLFYTMPLFLAVMSHFWIPGDRLTPIRTTGLLVAFSGVVIAIVWRGAGAVGEASFMGDVLALVASFSWALIAFIARTGLSHVAPDRQLVWQVAVSAVVLLAVAPFFGEFVRDLEPIHFWGVGFQIVVVAFAGYAFWLWLLTIYPASSVAAFSFLTPIFGVLFGWAILDEPLGSPIVVALGLVCLGLLLLNARPQVPQKV